MVEIMPLGTRIIVKKPKAEEKTESGIFLTGKAQRKPVYSEVVAIGPGTPDEPMVIDVGDKVLLPDTGEKDIIVDNVEYVIYKQEDILAIIKEK